jgi:hypothetical protein
VAERVRFAAFFITARLASQDTRQAFTDAMLDQLAALAGEELPTVLPGIPQEWCMLGLMERAARSCQKAGGRLVLVVDGLDEDRGTITGPDAHSIAGLLPADPPAGMRVIVTGRPNPTRLSPMTCLIGIRCATRPSSGSWPNPRTPGTCNAWATRN